MFPVLRSFKPIVDRRSRVLILGSMPGPEALRKQEYYGFERNHFWRIVPRIFGFRDLVDYQEKISFVRTHRIALWDVLHSCVRPGALDSDIRVLRLNNIPRLVKQYPHIRAVFINGRTAHQIFVKRFGPKVNRPVFYLPSTSPAHAALSFEKKLERWKVIRKWVQ